MYADEGENMRLTKGGRNSALVYAPQRDRAAFVRKVFSIVAMFLALNTVQILVCRAIAFYNVFGFNRCTPLEDASGKGVKVSGIVPNLSCDLDKSSEYKTAMSSGYAMTFLVIGVIASVIMTIIWIVGVCCAPQMFRSYPQNYGWGFTYAFCMGLFLNGICFLHAASDIMLAWGATTFFVVGLTAFAYYTDIDFTKCWFWSFVAFLIVSLCFMMFLTITSFYGGFASNGVMIGINCVFLVFTCLFFVIDMQMILGGKNRKHAFAYDDYMFGAIILYTDIIELFLQLLEIISRSKN